MKAEIRWTQSCIAVATVLFLQASLPTNASQKHVLKPGESLSSLARTFGVSVKDIMQANGIKDALNIRDGKVLTIPDAPKGITLPKSLHEPRLIGGDRVKVRNAPNGEARPIAYFDKGAPVLLTARKEGWAQVEIAGGKLGWVREDLLKSSGKAQLIQVASLPTKPASKPISKPAPKVVHVAHRTEEHHEKVKKTARSRQTEVAHRSGQSHKKPSAIKHHEVAKVQNKHWSQTGRQYARHSAPESSAPKAGNEVLREALSYRGTPYRYGGASRGGFDCSGFTSYLYNKRGAGLPHSASGQFGTGKHIAKGDMKPGDLVFFQTVTKGISHVGVYLGNGKFVHSSSRRAGGVRVDNLNEGYYNERFRGARRVR